MILLNNASIKRHLTLMILFISTVSVLLTTITISVIGVYNIKQSILDELLIAASIVGDRNSAALQFGEREFAENNLKVFTVKQSILRACLYDDLGQVFVRYSYDNDPNVVCPNNIKERQIIGENTIEVMRDIKRNDQRIGAIFIESSMKDVRQYISKQTSIAIIVSLAALIISYLMAVNIQKTISKPILSLAATFREVSQNKDYSVRARPFGLKKIGEKNEIASLTNAFNSMLQEIDERDKQLKQQNIELVRSKNIAETANRAKSQFLANISHELRTPLNAIIGFSSILMNQLFGPLGDEKYLDYSKDINESGCHLLDIINDILDLSKAEAGRLELNFEEINVPKAIKKCMTIVADRAEKGQVQLHCDLPKNLPSLIADRLRFIQILLNILSNAIKFTQAGGKVSLFIQTVEVSEVVTHFLITIQDTGIGMSKEDIDKAFQSFGQVDGGLNRKYEGSGLGLPLTKKLVEIHHGTIAIDSRVGIGTKVTINFPAIPPVEAFKNVEGNVRI